MDTLEKRLNEVAPGAVLKEVRNNPPDKRFVITGKSPIAPERGPTELSTASTRAEAVSRVEFLHGSRR